MANSNLVNARREKNDEFYTQFHDIQKEMDAYLDFNPDVFRDKIVYCNCDDPFESNFFRFFALNFEKLGLRQLITTSYKESPIVNTQLIWFGNTKHQEAIPKPVAYKFIVNSTEDMDGDGAFNLKDVAIKLRENKHNEWTALEGDGDFRSPECIELLKKADIVITNPPFSLFHEYVKQLFDYEKEFAIIGNLNALTCRKTFLKIRDNKVWLGAIPKALDFYVPDNYQEKASGCKVDEKGKRLVTVISRWYTNIDHGRRRQHLDLMTMEQNLKYSKHPKICSKDSYDKYDNFDAIEVPFVDAIPSDYDGMMGVPISFMDKYNPDQFEIVGYFQNYDLHTKVYPKQIQVSKNGGKSSVTKLNDNVAIEVPEPPYDTTYYIVDNKYYVAKYARIFIKHRNPHQASSI